MQPLLVTGRRVIGATIPLRGSRGWDWYYKAKEMQKIKPKPSPIWENKEKKPRTRVYFDLATETKESKRVVIELLDDIVPTTAMNFKNLIIGTNGLHYKDCTFFDIRKDQFVCSGAVKGEKRLGGYSSFAKQYFDDENFIAHHDIPGVVTMLNAGVHKNNSLFAITLKPMPHLDGRNVVVGHVVQGLEEITNLSHVYCYKGVPLDPVRIKSCGVMKSE
ncbi:hypothetical protein AV274_0398 [Blastocystis sp. ATCC 50177/Nand II]|uniref:Peptidyl-prolyl cis-trans isomerase n=2 Tax=Blastocystis sp. subtype 1 (strain ATCC 50177 / NandII) TaxID=478820 RepID=A0A196SLD3_BLAHN|nr:hypothetical protein AV274_0398 [Blastocystis sp. ATCC 50177/Nand II]